VLWLSGYYNGKRNNTIIEPLTINKNEEKINSYCNQHRETTVMDAVKNVLGFDKWVYEAFSLVADDKAGGLFLDWPGRREASGCIHHRKARRQ
jgi:hypothetical protein